MKHIRYHRKTERSQLINSNQPITKPVLRSTVSQILSQSTTNTASTRDATCTIPRSRPKLQSSISYNPNIRMCTIIPNTTTTSSKNTHHSTILSLLDELDAPKTETHPFLAAKGYKMVQKISGTKQSEIYEAIDTKTNKKVTIKVTPKAFPSNASDLVSPENLIKEATMQNHLTTYCSPFKNIPHFVAFYESSTAYYLITEFAGDVTLREFVYKAHAYIAQNKLSIKQWKQIVKCIFWQVAVTIHWLHNVMKCCHLALNLNNIMLSSKDLFVDDAVSGTGSVQINPNIEIKLVNFRNAKNFSDEINDDFYANHHHATKEDVRDLGVILYSMATGIVVINSPDDKSMLESIFLHQKQRFCSSKMIDVLKGIMNATESERFNIEKVLQHKWLKAYYSHYQESVKKTHQK